MPDLFQDVSRPAERLSLPEVPPGAGLPSETASRLDAARQRGLEALYGADWKGAGERLGAAVARDGAAAYERLGATPEAYGFVGDRAQAGEIARGLQAREQVLESVREGGPKPLRGPWPLPERTLPEVVVTGHQTEADREHFRPRAPYARCPALDERLDSLHRQIDAGGPNVAALRDEAALVQATYDAARYLGAPSMTPTRLNPIAPGGNQAMTVPYADGTIFANDAEQMRAELGHMVQHNRDPVGFIPKILAERALFPGQETYHMPGWLEHEAHAIVQPEVERWIKQIKAFNEGHGEDPYSPENPLFVYLTNLPDIQRYAFGRPVPP